MTTPNMPSMTSGSPAANKARRRGARKYTREDILKVRELTAAGVKQREISKKLSIPVGSIPSLLRRKLRKRRKTRSAKRTGRKFKAIKSSKTDQQALADLMLEHLMNNPGVDVENTWIEFFEAIKKVKELR